MTGSPPFEERKNFKTQKMVLNTQNYLFLRKHDEYQGKTETFVF